jgi:hypothetical protein
MAIEIYIVLFFFQWLDSPLGAKAASIFEASRSQFLDTLQSVGLLWTRDQLVAVDIVSYIYKMIT